MDRYGEKKVWEMYIEEIQKFAPHVQTFFFSKFGPRVSLESFQRNAHNSHSIFSQQSIYRIHPKNWWVSSAGYGYDLIELYQYLSEINGQNVEIYTGHKLWNDDEEMLKLDDLLNDIFPQSDLVLENEMMRSERLATHARVVINKQAQAQEEKWKERTERAKKQAPEYHKDDGVSVVIEFKRPENSDIVLNAIERKFPPTATVTNMIYFLYSLEVFAHSNVAFKVFDATGQLLNSGIDTPLNKIQPTIFIVLPFFY